MAIEMTLNKNENNIVIGNNFRSKNSQLDTRKVWPALNRRGVTTPSINNSNKSRSCNNNKVNVGISTSSFFFNNSNSSSSSSSSCLEIERQKVFEQFQDPESFHCAIGKILVTAQCFGLLPVSGILSSSSRGLIYRKKSFRNIYAIILLIIMMTIAVASVIHMIKSIDTRTFEIKGGIGAATAGAIFYGNGVLGALIFLWLAPRWASLQHEWRETELLIDRWGRPKLRRKFSIITAIVLLCALTEHVLSILKNTPSYRVKDSSKNGSFAHFLHEYSHNSHNFVINVWDYNLAMGIFLFVVSKMATFTWNFTDLFVMLVSTGLAESFKTLNKRMTSPNASTPSLMEWKLLRENYAALSSLVKRVDNDVSPIVLLSFANNLYFICLQLLNGLSPDEDGILSSVYFFGSFTFLVARTVGVTLLAARINDQSRIALPVLYTCPAKAYCIETQRLEHQLATDEIALSGLRFFSITRNFMLAVAGAIVTYEVVLLQFNVAINQK